MRAELIFSLLFILAMLVGCASNGEKAAPLTQDPLMAIYHGAAHDRPAPNDAGSNPTSEEQRTQPKPETEKPGDQTPQDNQTVSQKLTEADNEIDDSTPVSESEPRHQSLIPVTSLPDRPDPKSQEPEVIVKQESIKGDPLLSAHHRQIKAAPLSDEVEPSANLITGAPSAGEKRPLAAGQEEEPQRENVPQAMPNSQQETSASLHLQAAVISPASEMPTEERPKSEPVLANPPEQVQQKQVWIEQVDLIEAKGQIIIEIRLSAKTSPDIHMLDEQGDNPTLVLDFPGAIGKSFPYRISAPPTIATAIHTANYKEKARVVVDLLPEKSYEVQPAWLKGKNKFLVSISLQ